MSDPRKQVKKSRQQEILEVFDESDEPVLTTGEISEHINSATQETVRSDLKAMDGHRVSGRKTTQEWIWWVPTRDSDGGDEKVAAQDQLRKAIAELVISRRDFRLLTAALAVLAALSTVGVAIYLMLLAGIWLLPISRQSAIVVNYALMVTAGLIIVASGSAVLLRERVRK
jgi:hypothetical protein